MGRQPSTEFFFMIFKTSFAATPNTNEREEVFHSPVRVEGGHQAPPSDEACQPEKKTCKDATAKV